MHRRLPPRLRQWSVVTIAAALSAACVEQLTTSPSSGSLETIAASVSTAEPDLVPNSTPYRAAAYRHGTGRSGGASFTARALLGMDGETVLEVTTGELDSAAPSPLPLQKLQVKFLPNGEDVLSTSNYNREDLDGGEASFAYDEPGQHWMLQVQASIRTGNVKGKDRTGVVTVQERVNLRPDPSIQALLVESEVAPGTLLPVSADVAELNGDLGARYDLVLYLDGSEVDRVNGATVQEGDVVSHLFGDLELADAGTYNVEVRIEGVAPGDWDESNNSASATVVVRDAVELFETGSSNARETHFRSMLDQEGSWTSSDGTFTTDRTEQWRYDYQFQTAFVRSSTLLTAPMSIEVDGDLIDISATTSTPRHSVSYPGLYSTTCYHEWVVPTDANTQATYADVCLMDWDDSQPYADHTQLNVRTMAGAALYVSEGYQHRTGGTYGDYYWDLNYTSNSVYGGTLADWSGDVARLSLRVSDGSRTLGYDFEVPLHPNTYDYRQRLVYHATGNYFYSVNGAVGDCSNPGNWFTYDTGHVSGTRCQVRHRSEDGKSGYVTITP